MRHNILIILLIALLAMSCSSDSSLNEIDPSSGTKSGSYATMLPIGDRLYVVSKTQLTTFDVSIASSPVQIDKKNVGFDIESLYYHDGLLLIGSANNMYIYRIAEQGIPIRESVSQYNNIIGQEICTRDPIVARDNIAYVTLSTVSLECGWGRQINQLRVYDIGNLHAVKQLNIVEMSNPRGLGLGKNHLFVCDEIDGLVVFNIEQPTKPIKVRSYAGFKGYDLIVNDDKLIVVSDSALFQYDITDESDIRLLSRIQL